ncbi:hypothetical protein AB1Y20_004618 [Prymnesium parvum]|uniref:Glycolipid transfer protein domain-containing protein n=1 Tax=Prymnesium parvum TaxID=97485 RepID=A0AB34IZS8_PRYPA|mmetsp:Transcript_39402/g.97698  ORF Transcript_39402/g.97698 Transcript_39402/m.97698 type:complete len:269 (+) Transcript_39402:177-983(+)|eukprot:CAMPEP_0113276344 /NCGR_PEP_ID=MMETSP0008_2-20120614/25439_1 /TAXON_ID=97485 /ORGANISM="Prymnesium parvum" /LENGTH=268 /DNA_ID=CAMNT_0000126131 /DNA_START=77 /DNA_END=883 /DNA_ORIENTATION=+ /assembly_acc=CAM_ASM_000153
MSDGFMSLDVLAVGLLLAGVLSASIATIARRRSKLTISPSETLDSPLLPASDVEMWLSPVQHSVQLLRVALVGDTDVAIELLAVAGRDLCDMLENLGPFTAILDDVRDNLRKIQQSPFRPEGVDQLRALLEAECAQKVHRKPGRLHDKSAATGLVWSCRFIRFWEQVCRLSLEHRAGDHGKEQAVPFRRFIEGAYVKVLLPHNGWISEQSFRIALNGIPQDWRWQKLSHTEDAFWEDCAEWVEAMHSVTARAEAMLTELNLKDESKSI